MSWLYTIVFAGLMFSSNGSGTAVNTESIIQKTDKPAEVRNVDETENFSQTYPLNANGSVRLSNVNGSIIVEAWDRNEVKLEYVKTADSKERLADVEVKIDARADVFSVETDYGSWKDKDRSDRWRNGGKLQVDFHLMVPRGAVLNEIETVNGSVTVSNFVNVTKVSAVNGSINATNLRGTASLSTVNGEVIADFDRLETGSKISLDTVNGRVSLVIPSDSSATLKADSLNGNITNDFGLPVRKGKYIGRDLYGRLGSGDVQIRLNSVNGGLSIGRKNDGKSLSPATNLLPQKEKDDDDWDNNDNSSFSSAKMNKDVAKAVKDSVKASAKAVKETQNEINRIQPEIAKITADSIARAADAIEQTTRIVNSADYKERLKIAIDKQQAVWAKIADVGYIPRVEKKSDSIPVKGVPKVTIDAKGCDVKVNGWDKQEVQYVVTTFRSDRSAASIEIKDDHTDSTVTLKAMTTGKSGSNKAVESIIRGSQSAKVKLSNGETERYDMNDPAERAAFEKKYGNLSPSASVSASPSVSAYDIDALHVLPRVRIEIFVPAKSNLKIITDGEIRIEGVTGDVDLSGGDESINVRDVDGTLRVSSSDGRIRVIGFKGEIVAESSDGMISLEGDFKKLKARSNDGAIYLTLPDNAQADLEATGPGIHGEGIELTRVGGNEKLSKYRIGNGGASFQLETQSEIRVRSASNLKASF